WKDLRPDANGLTFSATHIPTIALGRDGQHLTIEHDNARTTKNLSAFSTVDADSYTQFEQRIEKYSRILRKTYSAIPPRLKNGGWNDRSELLSLGLQVRRLGKQDMRELLRVVGMNMADWLTEYFSTPLLQGVLAFDATLGTRYGPRAPNTVLTYLHRRAHIWNGLSHPLGGMGSLSDTLATITMQLGVEIRTDAPVKNVIMENDSASGVELASGETVLADAVVSNADPKTTFLSLLGNEHLDTGFMRRVRDIPMHGNAAKINIALDDLPHFSGLNSQDLGARLVIAPSIEAVEQVHDYSKYGEFSESPVMEITIPSVHDNTLAPDGKHVLSAIVQYAPYDLKESWNNGRGKFIKQVLDTLSVYAPDIQDKIHETQLSTPFDMEVQYQMTGGHWHHGELGLERFMMLRPVPGCAHYATPVPGLFLCGAGCHPGGGVMGAAGMNAARAVMRELT
ncbi:MAG: NAD(P)/FAD-dependent oxidoreductase, partial [Gammaproteobacteria bacterium]|nr:NAD(P)/FAD-dependent oxidoreductase [Gammaproteobacteria bacterium]